MKLDYKKMTGFAIFFAAALSIGILVKSPGVAENLGILKTPSVVALDPSIVPLDKEFSNTAGDSDGTKTHRIMCSLTETAGVDMGRPTDATSMPCTFTVTTAGPKLELTWAMADGMDEIEFYSTGYFDKDLGLYKMTILGENGHAIPFDEGSCMKVGRKVDCTYSIGDNHAISLATTT